MSANPDQLLSQTVILHHKPVGKYRKSYNNKKTGNMKKAMILLVMFMFAGYAEGEAQMYLKTIGRAVFKESAGFCIKPVAIYNIERTASINMTKIYSESLMRKQLPVLLGKSILDYVSNPDGINKQKTLSIPVTTYNTVAAENKAAENTAEQQAKSDSRNQQQKQDDNYCSRAIMASIISDHAEDEMQLTSRNTFQMPRWLIFLLLAVALYILYKTFRALKRYEEKVNPITETSTVNNGYGVPLPISADDSDLDIPENRQTEYSCRGIMLANEGGILVR